MPEIPAEVLAQAQELDKGRPGQVFRLTFDFVNYNFSDAVFDAISVAIQTAFAVIPGWAINNILFPIVDNQRKCILIIVRTGV